MNRNGQSHQKSNVKSALFSQKNRDTLHSIISQDFHVRTGASLNNIQIDRLERTLDHYVEEVYSVKGDQPLALLNREIIQVVTQDFSKYIQRKEVVRAAEQSPIKTVMDESLFKNTAQRFELLQQSRTDTTKTILPAIPDFRVSMDDDGPSSVELYERIKKSREQESVLSVQQPPGINNGVQKIVDADDMFRNTQIRQNQMTEIVLAERRQQPKMAPMDDKPLAIPPDGRDLFINNLQMAQPIQSEDRRLTLQQDFIIKQDSTVNYKEVENNLFINSGDRNWLYTNNGENRYSFTANFDPANSRQGFAPSPAVQQRFKNIVRIELVKATLPFEAVDTSVMQSGGSPSPAGNNTEYQYSTLAFPYIAVIIQELESNNFGTNNFIDRSFGIIQYDANWSPLTTYTLPVDGSTTTSNVSQVNRGYLCMIPKFMKCQRTYSPTPLATLHKLTISLLRPDGTLLSPTLDVIDIRNIFAGNSTGFPASPTSLYTGNDGTDPYYFFINTVPFFSRFSVSVGDRIQIAGFTYTQTTLDMNPGLVKFVNWINQTSGHIVANIGYNNGTVGTYSDDGSNSIGYANYIIIQAPYGDPTTGTTALDAFTGFQTPITTISGALITPTIIASLSSPRRLINLNRQVQISFRVITRQMDSVAQLRPDNM